jgi:lysophospholipase L1-like esterase
LPAEDRAMRFLALGDSYTIGESVPPADRWPVQLAAMLCERGIAIGEPEIIATTGWTTGELAEGIRRAAPRGPYDLVSLLIGVNNQYRGRPLEEYRRQFLELLGQAICFAGGEPGRVLVLSIPDWGVTPFGEDRDRAAITREINVFNTANHDGATRAGVRYVDVTPASRMAAYDRGLVASDGLHPSGAMYRRWAEIALPAALAALGRE